MTSELEALKTNEFLRRRKLRIQQVREQSKDIAKKIRQRAKVEKLRQVVDLDLEKQKEYLHRQGELVKKLEDLYVNGINNVGVSHRSASEVIQDELQDRVDLSKLRGREAAIKLRNKRQEKLDEQKKLLDRKLQAREAANELSREKSAATSKNTRKSVEDTQSKAGLPDEASNGDDKEKRVTNDMATQWDFESLPNEWEPNIPALPLPKDDRDSVRETNNNIESKSDKSKRLDLFALSDEMPSSLRGGLTNVEERAPVKPSVTLVSEYLQNRGLRLRETDTTGTSKKHSDDMLSIKQTILRTRSSKPEVSAKGSNIDKSTKSSIPDGVLTRKPSVTMYNHSTRNSKDLPCGEERLVVRERQNDADAYSRAMRELPTDNRVKDMEHGKKMQDLRSKVAMTKQNVEKEYEDTINFLNSLPKDKGNRPIKTAFMDARRQQMEKETRQHKLQQEYKKIEKDCRKHSCTKSRSKSKSPAKDVEDEFTGRDFQYSWMPVPETDGNLAIHTIPNTLREGKSANTVKFSKVDSYHEYRSRHKHTPPTKDTAGREKQASKRLEAVIIEKDSSESSDHSSIASGSSSVENIRLETKGAKNDKDLSDAERIIIYKILDSKNDKKCRKRAKLVKDIAKSLTSIEKTSKATHEDDGEVAKSKNKRIKAIGTDAENRVSFEQLNEGVYKTVNEKGDNITSMYFADNPREAHNTILTEDEVKYGRPCCCNRKTSRDEQRDMGTDLRWESGDPTNKPNTCVGCKCGCAGPSKPRKSNVPPVIQPSAATSISSFQTATNDKANNALPGGRYIKLVDEGGQETGKFYVGATGFIKDDAYEVVIQLRKKDGNDRSDEKEIREKTSENDLVKSSSEFLQPVTQVEVTSQATEENNYNAAKPVDAELKEQPPKLPPKNGEPIIAIPPEENIHQKERTVVTSKPSENVSAEKSTNPSNILSDKGVDTPFQLPYAIPSHFPKTDPIPRPATSTYTQTTLSSPNHRPVFFHMSSSTSTAYMSPPEMVLPPFLRQDYRMTDEEVYDPMQNFNMQEKIEVSEHQAYSEEYDGCRCKKCIHAKKVTLIRTKPAHCCKKHTKHGNTNTPPNTARSCPDEHDVCDVQHKFKEHKCKCQKCENLTPSHISAKPHAHKNKRPIPTNKRSRILTVQNNSSAASSYKTKFTNSEIHKNTNKTNLNPVIKEYVKKLLTLNKEGRKAVEVADQNCSAVTTPGSSIINVPYNKKTNKSIANKISLEEIKTMFKEQILDEYIKNIHNNTKSSMTSSKNNVTKNVKMSRVLRKKPLHKVKSLNISKNLLKTKNQGEIQQSSNNVLSSSSSTKGEISKTPVVSIPSKTKFRSKSSPTPRQINNVEPIRKPTISDIETERDVTDYNAKTSGTCNVPVNVNNIRNNDVKHMTTQIQQKTEVFTLPSHRASITTPSPDLDTATISQKEQRNVEIPMNTSTQTNHNIDSEINFTKLAEDKLQNMEKIADLTEKCTKRLSNLARVLEEVRKNKSLAYSQISTSDSPSDSDQKSDKNVADSKASLHFDAIDLHKSSETSSTVSTAAKSNEKDMPLDSTNYIPFLTDIPKPNTFKTPDCSLISSSSKSSDNSSLQTPIINMELSLSKNRGKPPPALSRIYLKHGQEHVVPHELSTVLEVDSPMSVKLKNQSSRDTRVEAIDSSNRLVNGHKDYEKNEKVSDSIGVEEPQVNPDLLQSNLDISKQQTKVSLTESSDDSKLQMMDLKQFNEIMLKPFISFHEHAKNCNVALDEGSNLEDVLKDAVADDISSLHSDGSLPDVIAELLKRNIISEPFKFDTASNVNSTTVSSESTLSVLALSNMRNERKKSSVMFQNKENTGETTDSLSISSNPDLENAFKKLGMRWASSTLKKTKERLALSSSSNTSSSSLSQFRFKSFNNHDVPALVTDSVSSVLNVSKNQRKGRIVPDSSRNAEQQTSLTNSMTVKEFLKNELAKKITFTNKSNRDDTEEEFVSLFETKMPEEMKHSSQMIREERSIDSVPSGNNRARTSTPVQLFKSMAYHSSSSSNMSNGLFSNADELSSVKVTSNSVKNHSTSEKDDLTIPNFSLRMKKSLSDCTSKSD